MAGKLFSSPLKSLVEYDLNNTASKNGVGCHTKLIFTSRSWLTRHLRPWKVLSLHFWTPLPILPPSLWKEEEGERNFFVVKRGMNLLYGFLLVLWKYCHFWWELAQFLHSPRWNVELGKSTHLPLTSHLATLMQGFLGISSLSCNSFQGKQKQLLRPVVSEC